MCTRLCLIRCRVSVENSVQLLIFGEALLLAGNMLKAAYAHNIDAYQSVGAEVSKAAREEAADVHVMLGYSKRLTDGALLKAKIQNSGMVTLLYEAVSIAMFILLDAQVELSTSNHSCWLHVVFLTWIAHLDGKAGVRFQVY